MSYNFYNSSVINDPQNWYHFTPGFNSNELDVIYKGIQSLEVQKATTIGGIVDARSSRVRWIPQNEQWQWLYRKLMDMAIEANNVLWNFDLISVDENIQYTEYHASEKGHYGWHQDFGPDNMCLRKVSLTVQLSDPSEYEGGDLEITKGGMSDESGYKMHRGKGTVVIFPSYMMHRVTPVTRGIRRSFVLWVGGSHYK
jgi:PKHD-type hydroxylase